MAEVCLCSENLLESFNLSSDEMKIVETINTIRKKKKKPYINNILTEVVDLTPENIKIIMSKLCERNVLETYERHGKKAYRVNISKTIEENKNKTNTNEEWIDLDSESDNSEDDLLERELQESRDF